MPRIPAGAGGEVGRALEQGGNQLANMGFALESKLTELRQMTELSQVTIDAKEKLVTAHEDILKSPEFNTNPEAARAELHKRAEEIKGQYKISDPKVLVHFNTQFENAKLSAITDITHAARKQAINLGVAAADLDLVKLQNLAFGAVDDKEYDRISAQARGRLMGLGAVGAMKPTEVVDKFQKWESSTAIGRAKRDLMIDPEGTLARLAEKSGPYAKINETDMTPLMDLAQKRVEHVQNTRRLDLERQQKEEQKATVNGAYSELMQMFTGDLGKAVEYARDPTNYPGLDEEKRGTLVRSLENGATWDRQQREQIQKKNNDLIFDNFLKNPAGMTEATIIGTDASPELKERLIGLQRQNNERKFKTDPTVQADVLSRIWSGQIKNRSELLAYAGKGLGVDKLEEMGKSIDLAQDPTKSQYFKLADDLYAQKYYGESKELAKKADFLFTLDQHVKRENLKGPDVFKRAKDLLVPMEESRWFEFLRSSRTRFQIEDEAKPGINSPEKTPAPAAPERDPKIQERINQLSGRYTGPEIAGFLKAKGIDPGLYGLSNE
jgi:hypothetical protein